MDIGNRLKEIRIAYGFSSQDALAEHAGVSRKHISGIESGAAEPTVKMLRGIVGSIGSSLAEFFQSRVVEKYRNPDHQKLHEELHFILEHGGDRALGITVNVRDLYQAALRDAEKAIQGQPREVAKSPPSRQRKVAP